jgi:hypothetical protein
MPAGIVLNIFLAFLPKILAAMMRFAGRPSISAVDMGVINKFYVFQFFAVFIFQFLGGAVLNQVRGRPRCPWLSAKPPLPCMYMHFTLGNTLQQKQKQKQQQKQHCSGASPHRRRR